MLSTVVTVGVGVAVGVAIAVAVGITLLLFALSFCRSVLFWWALLFLSCLCLLGGKEGMG